MSERPPYRTYDRDRLKHRIQTAFMAHQDEDSPYGAFRWFASRIGMSEKAVSAWCRDPDMSSARHAPGYVFSFLETVEHRADGPRLDQARRDLKRWREQEGGED